MSLNSNLSWNASTDLIAFDCVSAEWARPSQIGGDGCGGGQGEDVRKIYIKYKKLYQKMFSNLSVEWQHPCKKWLSSAAGTAPSSQSEKSKLLHYVLLVVCLMQLGLMTRPPRPVVCIVLLSFERSTQEGTRTCATIQRAPCRMHRM